MRLIKSSTVWSCSLHWSHYTVLSSCSGSTQHLFVWFIFAAFFLLPRFGAWHQEPLISICLCDVRNKRPCQAQQRTAEEQQQKSTKRHSQLHLQSWDFKKNNNNVVSEQTTNWMPMGHHVQSLSPSNVHWDSTTTTNTVWYTFFGSLREKITHWNREEFHHESNHTVRWYW